MSFFKLLFSAALIALAISLSMGEFTRPEVRDVTSANFSAIRVIKDIKEVSKVPHSIEHPAERAVVREYLSGRLAQMGFKPEIHAYDSIKSRTGGLVSIANIYAKMDPPGGKAASYILFVAHLDSRFKTVVKGAVNYSSGAADDGYGLGVILECSKLALSYRGAWKQGVKILFTDAEENMLDGMKKAVSEDSHIFDNVGLVINIEARGIKGPALLFETSPGNDRLTSLYKLAKYPYSYSLTGFVYSLMPNDTDFSVVKKDLAGFNFSVIDNLDYYHTNKDNFGNISAGSIQHYGSQIEPIVHEYLTNPQYKDSSFFKGKSDDVFFTAPLFGLINFSKNQYLIFNLIVFLLAYLIMRIYMVKGKCGASQIMKAISINILSLLSFSAIALGISYFLAYQNGTKFSLLRMSQIEYDGEIAVLFIATMAMVNYIVMRKCSKKIRREEFIFGSLILNLILAGVLYAYSGENFFLTVPSFLALTSLFINVRGKFAFANLITAVLIILVTAPFVYTLAVALTVGSLAVYSFIAALSLNLILPLADSYSRKVVL
jgi:hypothetical protein